MNLTPAQAKAVSARGNVLVVAGAGTGKTSTLVARCLDCLTVSKSRISLDELLMVTFTDAAAAEMRHRIRETFLQKISSGEKNSWLEEQLALFDAAHIGTLHQFCFQIIRQHFYKLGIDPQVSVMAEEEAWLQAREVLDRIFEHAYSGASKNAEEIQKLVQSQGAGEDETIRELVLKLHKYTQTLPDPAGWFVERLRSLEREEPVEWETWLRQTKQEWRREFLSTSEALSKENFLAGRCQAILKQLTPAFSNAEFARACAGIKAAIKEIPRGQKGATLSLMGEHLDAAEFLVSLTGQEGKEDPLRTDWGWIRGEMRTLLGMARKFGEEFSRSKRELGLVDFNDLEQYALELLWDRTANEPTAIALEWRKKLQFVFVDEYQDINAAQDKIVQALSREGNQANRFLVGDMKQSIYRFRLADPRIFQRYLEDWSTAENQIIVLAENFRSQPGILSFVNSLFETLMRKEVGGIDYDRQARLIAGEQEEAAVMKSPRPTAVELHLRLKKTAKSPAEDEEEGDSSLLELLESEKEARMIGLRILELKQENFSVRDRDKKIMRPVEWSDVAILLRAPSSKAEAFAKEFARLEIPLVVARTRFYESSEILDLLSLLRLLDNPLQDLPLIAVLRSPLAGLSLNELATIRLTGKGRFWHAVIRWRELDAAARKTEGHGPSPLSEKVELFLERVGRWRREARQTALTRCLEMIVSETDYQVWLLSRARGEQRWANVQRFLSLAEQFDRFQRQGLFRFLRFVEAQQKAETEPEIAATPYQNAVRLMSIHQSKGLEFPVVVLGDMGKRFNTRDLRARLVLDEEYGLCPQIKPPESGGYYPSLPLWLARKRQKRETLGEELRLLYVATTRARDLLILSGSLTQKAYETFWLNPSIKLDGQTVASATSFSDWLGIWFARQHGDAELDEAWQARKGHNEFVRWEMHADEELLSNPAETGREVIPRAELSVKQAEALATKLSWRYPHDSATRQAAKTSVSILRRQAGEADELAARMSQPTPAARFFRSRAPGSGGGVDRGRAHHKFMELFSLDSDPCPEGLRQEASRLEQEGKLSAEEIALLDFKSISGFWNSEFGHEIAARNEWVRREVPFTARFEPGELAGLMGMVEDHGLSGEFVVVQGVADLVVLEAQQIWLVDFKTDSVTHEEIAEKAKIYRPQLLLYARALNRIYGRPVNRCVLYFLETGSSVEIPVEDQVASG